MPVDSVHSEYAKRYTQWRRCRDCAEGTDNIKHAGERYLPKLSGQNIPDYDAYKDRALFYGATGRTVQGLLGSVFRKEYMIEYPYEDHVSLFTSTGIPLEEFSRQTVREILITGRAGILVDVPPSGDIRAYGALYTAENIVNWRTTVINGRRTLSMVILREDYEEQKAEDPFASECNTQYRVLSLLENGESYIYRQFIFRKPKNKEKYELIPELTVDPLRNGIRLDYIPFVFINTHDLTPEITKPPLLDLADVNLSHYRTSADLEHGAHYTALPTAVVVGFPTNKSFRIGSGVAWSTENTNANAFFLEYKGDGLGTLSELKKDKEQLMAVLGARLLEDQKKGVEAAETHKIRLSGESGALKNIANNASAGIEQALRWVAWWSGAQDTVIDDISFVLNTDFIDAPLSAQELTALMAAWQQGAISQNTFLWNLKRGEILPDGYTILDEKDQLDAEGMNTFTNNNVIEFTSAVVTSA